MVGGGTVVGVVGFFLGWLVLSGFFPGLTLKKILSSWLLCKGMRFFSFKIHREFRLWWVLALIARRRDALGDMKQQGFAVVYYIFRHLDLPKSSASEFTSIIFIVDQLTRMDIYLSCSKKTLQN